jgi:hypothetical protein
LLALGILRTLGWLLLLRLLRTLLLLLPLLGLLLRLLSALGLGLLPLFRLLSALLPAFLLLPGIALLVAVALSVHGSHRAEQQACAGDTSYSDKSHPRFLRSLSLGSVRRPLNNSASLDHLDHQHD